MMSNVFKAPLTGPADKDFEQWKNEFEIWLLFTDLEPGKEDPQLL